MELLNASEARELTKKNNEVSLSKEIQLITKLIEESISQGQYTVQVNKIGSHMAELLQSKGYSLHSDNSQTVISWQ